MPSTKKRGRPSSADLAIVHPTEILQRPDAPYDLGDEEAQEWWALVNRMPADWFPRETHGMLTNYCRHIVTARRVSELIRSLEGGKNLDIGEYEKLLRMREREVRAASMLATRMRLTQQTTYDKSKKKPAESIASPWAS